MTAHGQSNTVDTGWNLNFIVRVFSVEKTYFKSQTLRQSGATRIVIAHRLSTIIDADKIFYLDNGRIAEQGTYKELMDLNGRFAAMARRQIV